MSTDIHSMLETLSAAKSAMEELPNVRSELDHTRQELDVCHDKSNQLQATIDAQAAQITNLNSAIASMEASLKDARFLEGETRSRMESLLAVVQGAVGTITGAVNTVRPTPSPAEPSPQPSQVSEPSPQPQQSLPSSSGLESATDRPTDRRPTLEAVPVTSSSPQPPSEQPGGGSEPANQPVKQPLPPPVDVPKEAPPPQEPTKPYVDRPWHEKPNHVSRDEWVEGGGQDAPWRIAG